MQTRLSLSALVLAAGFAGQAFAETPLPVNDPFVSAKTRAEVQAELGTFRQAGVNPWSRGYNPLQGFQSATSRAAVSAEYVAARDQVRAFTGEDSGSMYLAQMRGNGQAAGTTLAGQPVRAE